MSLNKPTITKADFVASVADALQFMSYYHPVDFIQALGDAYEIEESPAAKDAIAQILTNSRMCAEGKRPICQDTGIVVAFVNVGTDVHWEQGADVEAWVTDVRPHSPKLQHRHPAPNAHPSQHSQNPRRYLCLGK